MISTVTTSTTLALVTAHFDVIAVISLIGLLVLKELASDDNESKWSVFSQYLDVGARTLLVVFGFVVIMKVVGALY